MPNTITSPNMGMPVPVVGTDPGPDWATNTNASLSIIDAHNHSAGQGVAINPSGLNINADLPFNGNNGTSYRSVRFNAQGSPLSTAGADINCIYDASGDLYFNDGAGNQVRITSGGSVTGSSGTITGLPSGTAGASFAAGTFTFVSATNTPATMQVGPLVIGAASASPKKVTLGASASQSANYPLTFPLVAPAANQVPVSDGSGQLSWSWGLLPIGSVVATFPNLTGAYSTSATTVADASGFVKCNGQTLADASSPMNGDVIPNINNTVFLAGNTTAGTSGGAATATLSSANLGSHTHTFTSSTSVASSSHTHLFPHVHEWAFFFNSNQFYYTKFTTQTGSVTIGSGDSAFMAEVADSANRTGAALNYLTTANSGNQDMYTSGVLSPPSGSGNSAATGTPSASTTVAGTTDATGSGTAFSILPTYITAVYLMRVK